MYHTHFGLDHPPFGITPDTQLFYGGAQRGDVLEALVYAITHGEGIVKVVGEVGSGKTMLCRMLQTRLPDSIDVVFLSNPRIDPADVVYAIAQEMRLRVAKTASRLDVQNALQRALLRKHAKGGRVVVFVEEAQGAPLDTLEEIRLLTNLETEREKLLQIVLFGQPELETLLSDPRIRQLRERITHSFHLQPLPSDQVADYLRHRLRRVGHPTGNLFDPKAVAALAGASHGLMRRINILADKSLLAAFAAGSAIVDQSHVQAAIRDSEYETAKPPAAPPAVRTRPPAWVVGTAGLALVTAAVGLTVWPGAPEPVQPAVTTVVDFGQRLEQLQGIAAQWLLKTDPKRLTIQIFQANADALNDLEQFLDAPVLGSVAEHVYVVESGRNGQGSYGVMLGDFESQSAAQAALKALPAELLRFEPKIRSIEQTRAAVSDRKT